MADDLSADYAASLDASAKARRRAEYEALVASSTPQPSTAPATNGAPAPAADGSMFDQGVATVGRNIREIPRQFVFGVGQGVSEAASKVGLSEGAPVGDQPTTVAGGISRATGQFLPGFMAASAAIAALPESLAGAGLIGLAANARSLVAGVVGGTLDFDPSEPRISNFVQESGLANPITEFLAADPNDGKALGTLKLAIENTGLGAATDGIVALARMNKARIVANRALEKAGAQTPEQALDAALSASRDVLDPPVDMKTLTGGDPSLPAVTSRVRDEAGRFGSAGARSADVAPMDVAGEFAQRIAEGAPPQKIYLNLARIDAPDDVKAAIDTLASRDADAINAARGGEHQSFEAVKALADELGLKPEAILNRERGPMGAAEAVAARKILTSSGEQVTALARKAASAEATPADLIGFQRATAIHYALQAEVIAARTETARALASWRIPAGGTDVRLSDVMESLNAAGGPDKVRKIAARMAMLADNPTAQAAAIRNGFKTNFRGAWDQLWFNSLLSSPATHIANITDNALTAALSIPERYGAALVDNTFGGGDVTAGEATSMLWGGMRGARDGIRAAWKALKTGEGSDAFSKFEQARPRAIRPETFGVGPDSALGHGINALGTAVDTPGRLLLSADEFFRAVNTRMELNAQAYRQAASEGLAGRAASARMAELVANPDDAMLRQAVEFGRTNTYTNSLGPIASSIAKVRDVVPGAKYIAPFVRTPANIMRYSFERTPLAPLSSSVRADIVAGGARASQAYARIGMGTTAMLAVADMAAHGQITGGGPEEPSLRAARERLGIPQYSIKVGDKWVSYQRLGYVGTLLGLAADAAEMQGLAGFEDGEKTLASVGLLFAKSMANKSYLSGMFEAASIIGEPQNDRKATEFLKRLGASFVPGSGLAAAVERGVDPTVRDTRTAEGDPSLEGSTDSATEFVREFINKVRSRTPGLSSSLPPVRDLWGKPKEYSSNLGVAYDIASPFGVREGKPDAVDQSILKNGIKIEMPERSIQGVPLTGDEYSRFVEIAGAPAKAYLDEYVKTPDFAAMSDGQNGMKALSIHRIVDGFRQAARAQLVAESESLRQRIEAQALLKQQLLTVPAGLQ